MPDTNKSTVEAKKSSYTEEEIKAYYQKGREVGRIEGMIAYQQRLVKNLEMDNAKLNEQLKKALK